MTILVLHFINSPKGLQISTNRTEIFGQITIQYLLSNEYKFIGINNKRASEDEYFRNTTGLSCQPKTLQEAFLHLQRF